MAVSSGKLMGPVAGQGDISGSAFAKLTMGKTMSHKTGNSMPQQPKMSGSVPSSFKMAKLGSPQVNSGEKVVNGKLMG